MTAMPKSEHFTTWIRDSFASTNLPWGTALHISERFAAWKRDSWESAIKHHCWTSLPILQRFLPWKRYSWASAKRPSCLVELLLSERFVAWKCHSWQWANRPLVGRHSPYLNVLQFENRIPEYQQFDHVAGRNYPYFKTFLTQKTRFLGISLFALIWKFRSLNIPFLTIHKWTPLQ